MPLTADEFSAGIKQADRDQAPAPAAPATGASTYRDLLAALERMRMESIAQFRTGNTEAGHAKVKEIDEILANPDVKRGLASISEAGIRGASEVASSFSLGAWRGDVVVAQKAGIPLSENSLIAQHGSVGKLMFKIQQGSASAYEAQQVYLHGQSATRFAKPITQTDPVTGKSRVVGEQPDTQVGADISGTTSALLTQFGAPDSEERIPLMAGTQKTVESLYQIAPTGAGSRLTGAFQQLAENFAGGPKTDAATKTAAFNQLSPVLDKFVGLVSTAPGEQLSVNRYLSSLSRLDKLTPQELNDKAYSGYAKYRKLRADLDYVNADIPDGDVVAYAVRGDPDPTIQSQIETSLDYANRVRDREAGIAMAAAGIAPGYDKDGRPNRAPVAKSILANVYLAHKNAIAEVEEQGQGGSDMRDAIIAAGLGKARSELSRATGIDFTKLSDSAFLALVKQELDLDAVNGSNAKLAVQVQAIPSTEDLAVGAETEAKTAGAAGDLRKSYKLQSAAGKLRDIKVFEEKRSPALSKKEQAEAQRIYQLSEKEYQAEESALAEVHDRVVNTALKHIPTSNGVFAFTDEDGFFSGAPGTLRSARYRMFEESGLRRLIPDKKDQDMILRAIRGQTPDSAKVILQDIVKETIAPGRAELPRDLGGTRYARLVDPDHRTTFTPPASLILALKASTGYPPAKEAVRTLAPTSTETQNQSAAASAYAELVSALSPADLEKLHKVLPPPAEPPQDVILRGLQARAMEAGDAKTVLEVNKIMTSAGEAIRKLRLDEQKLALDWFQSYGDAVEKANPDGVKAAAAKLSEYGITVPSDLKLSPAAAPTKPMPTED